MSYFAFFVVAGLAALAGRVDSKTTILPESEHQVWLKRVLKINDTPKDDVKIDEVARTVIGETGPIITHVIYKRHGKVPCYVCFKQPTLKDKPELINSQCYYPPGSKTTS